MARPFPPIPVRLAILASAAIGLLVLILIAAGMYIRGGGCWACGW